MRNSLDVIIIGAGTAGLSALREVRKRTERFVVINDGPWGTMCARAGCMPCKALIAAANAFHARWWSTEALTISDLLRMPFYHPVHEEGLRTALRRLSAQLPAATTDSDLDRRG